ncbi:MAG: Gfo/Idh/MocA family oxidoreductase [Alphaproteobacteria bacterium]|nr:Gfo/Idh/MocA family oxidoreductase [Alphaproteobacteria bacterium]
MLRIAVIGLGKMGLSHYAIVNTHPNVKLVAVCDASEYVLSVLAKHAGVSTFVDYRKLLASEELDAVVVATPSSTHVEIVRAALEAGLHVFCEKPFCLGAEVGFQLADQAEAAKRVNQVGYHYRFIGVFHELKRLLDCKTIGKVHHVRAEAFGPVVLRPKIITWRSKKIEGGGCLHDYASHAIDLLNYLLGPPQSVRGTLFGRLYSQDVEDEVYATFNYGNGATGTLAANWSDESTRKMSMKISLWGANGRVVADRQELFVYLRRTEGLPTNFRKGWNVIRTMDVTSPVWFYLRGEEYSAQIGHFVDAITSGHAITRSTFRSAAETQVVIDSMIRDAESAVARELGWAARSQPQEAGLRSLASPCPRPESPAAVR